MNDCVLSVNNLRKVFGETVAVDDLSFDLCGNEIVGLLGANGAGKTTAIHMLLGLIKPTAGSIRTFGEDFARNRIKLLKRINFSSAYTNLPSNLKVWQNLFIFAKLYGVPDARAKMDELLELLEITHLKNSITGHLSTGESTRLNLCKALLNDPELLFLDEPTASLDPDIADKVRKIILKIQREREISILYTSHNMREIEMVCDRIIFIHRGRKIAEGSSEAIIRQFQRKSLEEVFIHIARDGDVKDKEETES